MVYLVGVPSPHVAIGTSALAVAANAASGLLQHARAGTVKWRCGGIFAVAGVAGAFAGSTLGKAIDGQKLLFAFALLMVVVGVLMLRGRGNPGVPGAQCNRDNASRVMAFGLGTGAFSGFFGIGGGFLIVPALTLLLGLVMRRAIATSLAIITLTGLAALASHLAHGAQPDWPLTLILCIAAAGGALAGTALGRILNPQTLAHAFGVVVAVVALFLLIDVLMIGGPPTG